MRYTNYYKTIFISDLHLGTKGCQSDKILHLLKTTESDFLILNGDIIDFWALRRKSYWPKEHNTIIQKILKKARHDTKVIFVCGNHDECLRNYIGYNFGDILICDEYIHDLQNGKKLLCVHGDKFDMITTHHKWLAIIGDIGYELLITINRHQNKIRKFFKINEWSLANHIKMIVKDAVKFISDYEETVVSSAKKINVDGVIAGHIHKANLCYMSDIIYGNCGDGVESCTFIAENLDSSLSLLSYANDGVEELRHIY
jgi:UDP-2,3-diacylglucosamine pyrophosphatase LpxH